MRAWLVVLAACGAPPASPQPIVAQPAAEPTGPELWTPAPGAIALGVLGDAVVWFAPVDGGSDVDLDANGVFEHPGGGRLDSPRVAHVPVGARGFAASDSVLVWGEGSAVQRIQLGEMRVTDAHGNTRRGHVVGDAREVAHVDGTVASVAQRGAWLAIGVDLSASAQLVRARLGGATYTSSLDGVAPIVAAGSAGFAVGTSTTWYYVDDEGGVSAAPVDGGVSALAADGDDVFAGNTAIYERIGAGRLMKLGPAGGPVTAMAVDATYVYWAIAAGDREPAIYRALRKKPELELVTKIGAASALAVAGPYLYWIDPSDGAIHRIRR